MDDDQGIQNRHQKLYGLLFRQSSAVLYDILFQINTLDIFHDKVGSVVLIEKFINIDHIRMAVEFGNGLRFLIELFRTKVEIIALLTLKGTDRRIASVSVNQRVGQIFLDGNGLVIP